MKTKEQWLEEFRKEHGVSKHEEDYKDCSCSTGDDPRHYDLIYEYKSSQYIQEWISNALEQYAKEYCLGVAEKCFPGLLTVNADEKDLMEINKVSYYNKGICKFLYDMKKEIGV